MDDTEERFHKLEKLLAATLARADVNYRWSGQVIETNDGLPLIGETAEKQFVATGIAGNGMTFGTWAGSWRATRRIGRKNPWQALFNVSRKKLLGGTWDYIKENLDYPYYMVKDRLFAAEGKTLRGSNGATVRSSSSTANAWPPTVISREDHNLLAACTHLGCIVHWNRPSLRGLSMSWLEIQGDGRGTCRAGGNTSGENRARSGNLTSRNLREVNGDVSFFNGWAPLHDCSVDGRRASRRRVRRFWLAMERKKPRSSVSRVGLP